MNNSKYERIAEKGLIKLLLPLQSLGLLYKVKLTETSEKADCYTLFLISSSMRKTASQFSFSHVSA